MSKPASRDRLFEPISRCRSNLTAIPSNQATRELAVLPSENTTQCAAVRNGSLIMSDQTIDSSVFLSSHNSADRIATADYALVISAH